MLCVLCWAQALQQWKQQAAVPPDASCIVVALQEETQAHTAVQCVAQPGIAWYSHGNLR
jgi:hypothetical protein